MQKDELPFLIASGEIKTLRALLDHFPSDHPSLASYLEMTPNELSTLIDHPTQILLLHAVTIARFYGVHVNQIADLVTAQIDENR